MPDLQNIYPDSEKSRQILARARPNGLQNYRTVFKSRPGCNINSSYFLLLQTRQNFTETRNKTQSLKQKMLEMRQQKQEEPPGTQTSKNCNKEGYLFLMEKSKLIFLFAPFS